MLYDVLRRKQYIRIWQKEELNLRYVRRKLLQALWVNILDAILCVFTTKRSMNSYYGWFVALRENKELGMRAICLYLCQPSS